MVTKTQPSAIEGLDQLELGGALPQRGPGRAARSVWRQPAEAARRGYRPRLLAAVVRHRLEPYVLKGPRWFPDPWQLMHTSCCGRRRITLRRAAEGTGSPAGDRHGSRAFGPGSRAGARECPIITGCRSCHRSSVPFAIFSSANTPGGGHPLLMVPAPRHRSPNG